MPFSVIAFLLHTPFCIAVVNNGVNLMLQREWREKSASQPSYSSEKSGIIQQRDTNWIELGKTCPRLARKM
jgi:hypothetical protein